MSKVINEKLTTIEEKLGDIEKAVLAGKRAISYALKYSGVETTVPYDDNDQTYETFKFYADKIKALGHNPMILEVTIPSTANTDYKRSVVLPMDFSNGYTATSLNDIADEIIAGDLNTYSASPAIKATETEEEHFAQDIYGNYCVDGNYPPTTEDIGEYLEEDEQVEMEEAMEVLGIDASIPRVLADDDPNYDYTVDWGDGTGEFVFDPGASYDDNKGAIWHTYEKAGTYDITVTGDFRYVSSTRSADMPSYRTDSSTSSGYVEDKDGTYIYSGLNYGMYSYLTSIIAWGNMRYLSMEYAFSQCCNLTSIPMYDTTNAFIDVTTFYYAFNYCSKLDSLPYNANTDNGLFSGCTAVTNFGYAFRYCSSITSSIPDKFIDGCSGVTSVAGMFAYAKCAGDLPTHLFAGMSALTDAQQVFVNCSLSGDVSEELFADCDKITTIYRLFYGCTELGGKLTRNVIGKLSSLTDMRQAFYNTDIEGFDADAFHDISSNSLNCRQAFFGCSGIKEIPKGLIEGMTAEEATAAGVNNGEAFSALSGTALMLENMFEQCTGIETIPSTVLTNLKVGNARGMFGGCTGITSELPNAPACGDWDNYDTMQKWYGAFGNCRNMNGYSNTIPFELGGAQNRKYNDGHVGMICLEDKTLVEPWAYSYDSSNGPIGIVYADVYLDPSNSVATLASGSGNVVVAGTEGAEHKLFVCMLNDITTPTDSSMHATMGWVDSQAHAEQLTNITYTTNVNVGYNRFTTWTDNGDGTYTQTRETTRYNGEAYHKAIGEWIDTNGYDITRYPAYCQCQRYSIGVSEGDCFLPDGADLWDQFVQREWFADIITNNIIAGGPHTSSTAYPIYTGTHYWASAEYSSTGAWHCNTSGANLVSNSKWGSRYVRPSLALTLS